MRSTSSFFFFGCSILLLACSDSSSSSSSSSGGSSGTADSGSAAVSDCTTFVDRTGDADVRAIKWDIQVSSLPERCMKIKVGQAAKFTNATGGPPEFASHPITTNGGTLPSPITNIDQTTGEVSFAAKGTYGFKCDIHPAMIGAFQVVE